MSHDRDHAEQTRFNHPLVTQAGFAKPWLAVTGFWPLCRPCWRYDPGALKQIAPFARFQPCGPAGRSPLLGGLRQQHASGRPMCRPPVHMPFGILLELSRDISANGSYIQNKQRWPGRSCVAARRFNPPLRPKDSDVSEWANHGVNQWEVSASCIGSLSFFSFSCCSERADFPR